MSDETPVTVNELIDFLRLLIEETPTLGTAQLRLPEDKTVTSLVFDHGHHVLRLIDKW
jgi:hypothetical protein